MVSCDVWFIADNLSQGSATDATASRPYVLKGWYCRWHVSYIRAKTSSPPVDNLSAFDCMEWLVCESTRS